VKYDRLGALATVVAAVGAVALELASGAGVGAVAGCNGGCVHLGGHCAQGGGQSDCCNGLVCNFDATYQQTLCVAPSCTPSGSGVCNGGDLCCGNGLGACPADAPFTCPGDPNCYPSAADAVAGCGTPCIECGAAGGGSSGGGAGGGGGGGGAGGGGGGGATASCHLGTTFVQNASGPCPAGSSVCGGTDPLGTNNSPFCGDPKMQCCCGGGGLSYRCWGCGVDEVCGSGSYFGYCNCP
jgi:hypothetical protein